MTLLIILILAAVLVVFGIFLIKKTAKNKMSGTGNIVETSRPTPPSENPGSIPDKAGTKGDGDSVLSSGGQG